MTEAQNWVLIGVFGALIFGSFCLAVLFFDRQLRLTRELIVAHVEALDTKLSGLDIKLSGMIDALDKDVQVLATRVFGTDRE